MNSDIFIPARLQSIRLPKKHLLELNGKPVIHHLVNRLKHCKKIRKIIVCTTTLTSDDPLVNYLDKEGILYFRGNENDILVRFLECAQKFDTDIIVDVEGDDIFTDPFYVDKIVEEMEKNELDFVSGNTSSHNFDSKCGFPHGIVPAGIHRTALKKICNLKISTNTDTGYKEFFTKYDFFKTKYIFPESNLIVPSNLRLTLDYKEDFDLAKAVFKKLNNNFSFNDLLNLFNTEPKLLKINQCIIEKWQSNYNKHIANFSLRNEHE
jgi:spore coat polysaccharide biosynthesis protein SpsF